VKKENKMKKLQRLEILRTGLGDVILSKNFGNKDSIRVEAEDLKRLLDDAKNRALQFIGIVLPKRKAWGSYSKMHSFGSCDYRLCRGNNPEVMIEIYDRSGDKIQISVRFTSWSNVEEQFKELEYSKREV